MNFGLTCPTGYGMFMMFKEITFHETYSASFRYRLVTRLKANGNRNPTGVFPQAVFHQTSQKEGVLRE